MKRKTLSPFFVAAATVPIMWFNLPNLAKFADKTDSGSYKYSFVTTDTMGTTVATPNSVSQAKLAKAIRDYPQQ